MYIMIQSSDPPETRICGKVSFLWSSFCDGASPEELAGHLAKVEVFGALSEEEIL